jgi:hypothetical protein
MAVILGQDKTGIVPAKIGHMISPIIDILVILGQNMYRSPVETNILVATKRWINILWCLAVALASEWCSRITPFCLFVLNT